MKPLPVLLFFLAGFNAFAGADPRDGFGHNWVRTHPFTIMALASDRFDNFDINEYAAANLNVNLNWERQFDMITNSAAFGMPWIYNVQANPGGLTPAITNEIVDAYNIDPDGANWLVWDEPSFLQFTNAAEVLDWIKGTYPDTLIFSDARPYGDTTESYWGGPNPPQGWAYHTDYLHDFAAIVRPDVLMYNLYPFTDGGGTANIYWGARLVTEAAKPANLPYWVFIQAFGDNSRWRIPSESDVRVETFIHLAYGFSGIAFFTYEDAIGPAMVDAAGQPRPLYWIVRELSPEIFNLGERIKFLTHRSSRYAPGSDGGVENSVPFGITHWSTFKGNDDPHILDLGPDLSKPGNEGLEKDAMISFLRDDDGNRYFMLVNVYNGPTLSATDAALDFFIQFDWQVDHLYRIDRQTGHEVLVTFSNNLLEVELPGGTGDLYRYGELRHPAIAGTFFEEDFENARDPGYTPGALLDSQNGWTTSPSPVLPIGDTDADFDGQYLDGWASGSGTDTTHTNPAGMGGSLDPNRIAILSWDWKLDSQSHNQAIGFQGSGGGAGQVSELAWNALDDLGVARFRFIAGGVEKFFDMAITVPSTNPVRFEIVIDGLANFIHGVMDGVDTIRFEITDQEISDLQGIRLFADPGPNRRFPRADDILLIDAVAGESVVPGPQLNSIFVEDTVGFEFLSETGVSYRLEHSLSGISWTPVNATYEGTGGIFHVFDPEGYDSNKTYRVVPL
jgi:hypothetical protein